MANAYPTLYPSGFNGTYTDFNKAKIDRSGALRMNVGTVAVPAATASGTLIGLVPVRKGAKVLNNGSSAWFDALDTNSAVTVSIGVVYQSGSASSASPAAYVSASTTGQAGGNVVLNGVKGGETYVVLDDGWVAATTAGASTTTTGNINFNIGISYDLNALL